MKDLDKFKNEMNLSGQNVYVGHRYVPKIMGDWDNTQIYEPLSIVQYQGNSFTSRQYAPSGIEITNKDYWASTGNYNAQVEQYRQDVRNLENDFNNFNVEVINARNGEATLNDRLVKDAQEVTAQFEKNVSKTDFNSKISKVLERMENIHINIKDFGGVGDWDNVTGTGTDNLPAYNAALDYLSSRGGGTIYTPDGDYWISDRIHVQQSNIHFVTAKDATIRATNFLTDGDAVITFRGGVTGGQVPNTLIENCSVTGGTYISMTENTNSIAFVRCDGCYVYDVTVASGNKGVTTQEYNNNVHFEKIHVLSAPQGAITIETHSNNVIVKDVVIEECGRAIHVTFDVNDVIIENLICHKSTGDGVSISISKNVQLKNVILKNVTGRGINADNSTNMQINDVQLENIESYGLYMHTISGVLQVERVMMNNIATNGLHTGVYLNTVKIPYSIYNCTLVGNAHKYAVAVTSSTGHSGQFRGNNFAKGTSDDVGYFAYDEDKPKVIDDIFGDVLYRT